MKKNLTKPRINVFLAILLIILALYSLSLIFLLGWGLLKSLQDKVDYIMQGASASSFPKSFTLSNYVSAFKELKLKLGVEFGGRPVYFGEMLFNSLVYSISCAVVSTLSPCIMGYLTVRIRTNFNKLINGIFYFCLLVPVFGAMPSMIQMMTSLRLINTWVGAIVMKMGFTGTYFLIFQASFRSLSGEYAEAAKIDGANRYQIMFGIEFQLVKTIIMISFVLDFIGFWNDYQTPMIYMPNHPTAAYGLWRMNSRASSYTDYVIFKVAGFMILIFPTFVLFMFFKDAMIGNLTIGGLKG